MQQFPRIARLFVINLIVLVAIVVSVEVAARMAYSVFSEEGSFSRKPLFTSPWFTSTGQLSPALQSRDDSLVGAFRHQASGLPLAKPDNEIRIVALGGSTTKNGHAWTHHGTDYASQLQARLSARFPDRTVRVLNAGSDSFSSAHSLVNLSLRISAFAPDLIIVMHNINDRSVAYYGDRTWPDYANKYMNPGFLAPEVQRFDGLYGTVLQFRTLSALGAHKMIGNREMNRDADSADALRYFLRNLRLIAAVASDSETQVLLLTQPHDRARMHATEAVHHALFNDAIRRNQWAANVTVIDVAAAMDSKADLFIDPIHYTLSGVKALAGHLEPAVLEALSRE